MKLSEAIKTFKVEGLDEAALGGQEEAFQTCMLFLRGVEKSKSQNKRRGSYGLKHLVENPSGRYGSPSSNDCYAGYVYEGTFITCCTRIRFQNSAIRQSHQGDIQHP